MQNLPNLSISRRKIDGPTLYPYEPSTDEYTYVASAFNLAIPMFTNPWSKEVFANIALLFDSHSMQSQLFQEDKSQAEASVFWFTRELQTRPPRIVLEDNIVNTGCLGYHPRLPWDNDDGNFPFEMQGVHLNTKISIMISRMALMLWLIIPIP